jgi:hypothetical protein
MKKSVVQESEVKAPRHLSHAVSTIKEKWIDKKGSVEGVTAHILSHILKGPIPNIKNARANNSELCIIRPESMPFSSKII